MNRRRARTFGCGALDANRWKPDGLKWRAHSCVPQRHSPQTSRQALGNPAMLTSVVGQDFILRPIFSRPSRSRFPLRFVAPETSLPGIDSRSCRCLGTAGKLSAGTARMSAWATRIHCDPCPQSRRLVPSEGVPPGTVSRSCRRLWIAKTPNCRRAPHRNGLTDS